MKNGYIYKPNWGQNCKVLMFDERETFFEAVNERNELAFGKRKSVTYTRTTTEFFKANSTLLFDTELTKQEERIHKPFLPLRLNCFKEAFWSAEKFEKISDFKSFLTAHSIDYTELDNLNTDKVVIFPSGQRNSFKKPVLLEKSVGFFDGLELMHKCFTIQQQYIDPKKLYFSRFRVIKNGREEKRLTGFGLYRTGIKENIPSFYLGGFMSLLELEIDTSLIV